MNLKLSEEEEMLRTMARDFLTKKLSKIAVKEIQASESGYSPELWQEMAGLGWQGLVVPEKYGGNGMSFLDLAILLEEMGRACLSGPFFTTVLLGAYPLMFAGTEAQKQVYLRAIADGKAIFSSAFVETDGQYEPASVRTRAMVEQGGYAISGIKLFVPYANIADYLIVIARTSDKVNPAEGLTAFIVDTKATGVKTSVLRTIDDEKLCEVVLENVYVPAANVLGKVDHAWTGVRRTVDRAAIARCCDTVGALQAALDMTVQYAKDRKQFDQPIGKFQIIQHYCASMATDVEGLRYVTYQAAWTHAEGMTFTREAAIAKAWASEAGERVLATAHQVHGAIGVTIDHDLQYYTKRVKAAAAVYGDADYHRELLAQQMGL